MSRCFACDQDLDPSMFWKDKSRSSGLASRCKPCSAERAAQWTKENRDKVTPRSIAWAKGNPEKVAAAKRANRVKSPHVHNANEMHRYARKVSVTPLWANLPAIVDLYESASAWNDIWPDDPVNVDHIVPLRSKIVSGLHAFTNLRILRAKPNQRKGNRYWPDMPV